MKNHALGYQNQPLSKFPSLGRPNNIKVSKKHFLLTDGIFETGAYGVPSKSQNQTVLGQGVPFSTKVYKIRLSFGQKTIL